MKIVACLAWYDEPLPFLDRCIRSLAGIADHLVAVDGAWELYPDGQATSAAEQFEVVKYAADDVGIDHEIFSGRNWNSQVEKRDWLMRHAAQRGDWLLVIDGDEHVTGATALLVEQTLQATELDVATVVCRHAGSDPRYAAPIRRVYRASAGVSVQTAHNGYRTADGRWLHGDPTRVKLEPAVLLPLSIEHDGRNRGTERNDAARGYRMARRRERVEAWA